MDLGRLFSARTVAVIGGGAWCASIIEAARRIGFGGKIFPVHPEGKEIAGLQSLRSLEDWTGPIDAAFVGVNRTATIEVVAALAARGAGGAICFASGFSEASAEDGDAADLQAELVARAGNMPLLGPNCYGFVNALDRVAVWPDQHGLTPVDRGVGILTQSSNMAINMTMQQRGLPIGMVVTCGNQAQTRQADIALHLLEDARITALGLHVEGFGDVSAWHRVALKAQERGVPIVVLKVGASEQAARATVSHTASMAGSDAGAGALLTRLGFGRARDVPTFLEALKVLHCFGRLDSTALSSISCSGGEAALAADTAVGRQVFFPNLTGAQEEALGAALGPMVALANPLDYHTYIWRDSAAMARAWQPMAAEHVGLTMAIVDYPTTDAGDWRCATDAALQVRAATGRPVAVVASLQECMPPDVAGELMAGGVVPLLGLTEALSAAEIAATLEPPAEVPPLTPAREGVGETLTEAEAKFSLSEFDLDLPRRVAGDLDEVLESAVTIMPPLVLKAQGLAHKSESGAVALGLDHAGLEDAALGMPGNTFLVEEMIADGVAELLVGVTSDTAHGMLLTIGAGGVMTEVWQDTVCLLMPVTEGQVDLALTRLKTAKLLDGFRGKPAASRPAIVAAVMAVQAYVMKHHPTVAEVEINPLICTPTRAVAVDALIRKVE